MDITLFKFNGLQKTTRLDVLVNAAGILRMGATDALS
ncbi:2,3-dihydroxybenzoate-2,3-dehydrogenase, partial [Salmonella enterica subsp. enterica serovar Heidelberg str. 622737-11]